jgi:hypothetical protein
MKKKKSKQKYSLFIIFLILSIIFLCFLVIKIQDKNKVCFDETCFKVEKAISSEERETGLMNREFLQDNNGMIFIFEKEDIYSFWMKDTLIPLDIIWINSSDNIVFIYRNALPCKDTCPPIIPTANAKYVLEINAGLADKYNIDVGDKVKIY